MMHLFQQLERYRVERWKLVRGKGWQWVTIGFFNAACSLEARRKGREALADRVCILRAVATGEEESARH